MAHYCDIAPYDPLHASYHDTEYGFPSREERVLFERMVMEIMQAGLSWGTILKKRSALNHAFEGYDVDKIAAYGAKDKMRLLGDASIIRNRLKIEAVIYNAGQVQALRQTHGSFAAWLDSYHPRNKDEWVKLMKQNFRFMGPEIVGEFLMSLGYLSGSHKASCPVYEKIIKIMKKGGKRGV
ncbi:MAG: DNA-3-methyladenine glycosylase I [Bdellovibrionales bacterium]